MDSVCDCDDWYEVDFLEKMMRTADELSADLVMCNINYAFPGGRKKTLCRMRSARKNGHNTGLSCLFVDDPAALWCERTVCGR